MHIKLNITSKFSHDDIKSLAEHNKHGKSKSIEITHNTQQFVGCCLCFVLCFCIFIIVHANIYAVLHQPARILSLSLSFSISFNNANGDVGCIRSCMNYF